MVIIVRMMGGLGNQIFIYAFIKKLLRIFPHANVFLDLKWYECHSVRKFELNQFVLDNRIQILDKQSISRIVVLKYNVTQTMYKLFKLIYRLLPLNKRYIFTKRLFIFLSKHGYCYNVHEYADINILNQKYIFVYGYFQDYRYIKDVDSLLKYDFQLKKKSDKYKYYKNKIKKFDCAVSVRWGDDYVQFGWPLCSEKYFRNGLDYLLTNTIVNQIFVFGDDMEKIKKNPLWFEFGKKIIFVEDLTPCEQLTLMMQFDSYIISNSTFSWLGAILGQKAKNIIAPQKWESATNTIDTGLYIDNMIIIEN